MLVRQADCGYHQRCAASRFDGRHRPAHRFRALRGPFRRRGRCGARVSWWSYVVYIIIRTYSNSPDNPAAAPKAPHSPQPASLQPSIRQVLELIRPNQQPVCNTRVSRAEQSRATGPISPLQLPDLKPLAKGSCSPRVPGSLALWPESPTISKAASGIARCRSHADLAGHTTS